MNDKKGLIFNIQRYSIHDGPGIRTTVFVKGCPLHCRWCANPDSLRSYPEIMTYDMKCIKCGRCTERCPEEAITIDGSHIKIDRERCNLCMECAEVCPSGAIERVGRYMTIGEVLLEIEKDRLFYSNSGGGVTISGGEPLLQWEFVLNLLKECKDRGLHTTLDTCGYAKWGILEKVLEYCDLVLYDIKHMDPLMHKKGVGVTNELILENVEKTARKVRTWLRRPVIPNYNDSESEIRKLAEFGSTLGVEKLSLLPYHELGASKYESLGFSYQFKRESPTEDCLQRLKETIESSGLEVTIGY